MRHKIYVRPKRWYHLLYPPWWRTAYRMQKIIEGYVEEIWELQKRREDNLKLISNTRWL